MGCNEKSAMDSRTSSLSNYLWMSKVWITGCLFLFGLSAHAGQKALVLIDMQYDHLTLLNYGVSAQKYKVLLEKQKQLIDAAKREQIPIVVVEYRVATEDYYPVNQQLLDHIGDYEKKAKFTKVRNSLFDFFNFSRPAAEEQLKQWGVTDLVVAGANGDWCIKETIADALESGYKVHAYTEGIADFERRKRTVMTYPYSFKEQLPELSSQWNNKGFTEFSRLEQVFPAHPQVSTPALDITGAR